MNIIKAARAFREMGEPDPWRLAFDVCVKQRFLPHRTYIWRDADGYYNTPILEWNIGPWTIWTDWKERERQLRSMKDLVRQDPEVRDASGCGNLGRESWPDAK